MTLDHASTLCIEKPDVLHSRDKLDFGRGFYLTAMRDQAVRYAERFTRRGKDAFINEYELDEETPEFVTKSMRWHSSTIPTHISSSVRVWPTCIAAATSIWPTN